APAHLAAVASAVPEHEVDRAAAAAALARLFPAEDPATIAELLERSGVERRFLALPVERTLALRGFTERNRAWREAALELAARAAARALERSRIAPESIDLLVDVSCTGIAIPALDVDLAPRLGLRSDVRRVPITESGCAAGALALAVAGGFVAGGERALVVAVELCSLSLV